MEELLTAASLDDRDAKKVARLVNALEVGKEDSGTLAERRAKLFGNYKVLTTFNPKKLGEESNAAGGKWVRPNSLPSRLGFLVEGLYQNVVESPDRPVAVNLVLMSFLFRLFVVTVVLRGDCDFLDQPEREEISKRRVVDVRGLTDLCVRARFDSPLIRLGLFGWKGPGLTLRIGPGSSVILDASYVDDRLRIGKGASGVRFVLERVGVAPEVDDAAERWRRVVGSRLIIGKRGLVGILAVASGLAIGAGRRWLGGAGLLLAALTTVSTGGIIREEKPQPEV